MDKNGNITITDWIKGMAQSAILGNETIIGCEIFEEPGILKANNVPSADSSKVNDSGYVTLTGMPIADVTNYNSSNVLQRTVLTEGGQLLSIQNADTALATNLSQGWDACVWNQTYTVVSYAQSGTGYIGVIWHDASSNSASWESAKIGSLTGTHCIKLLKAQDGYMYFTNGNTIGRITNITGGTGAVTVTSSSNVLDLPDNEYAVTMAELGSNLLIGTQYGYSYSQRQNFAGANIYPWDRVSSSFRLPVRINENGINAMVSNKNQVYFSAGNNGNIYVTDGTNYQLVKTLPFCKTKKFGPNSYVYPNAMTINQAGNLLIGLSTEYTSGSPSTTGVWEIGLTQGYPTHLPFISIDGNTGDSSTLKIGSVRVLASDTISFGCQSNSTYKLLTTTYNLNANTRYDTQAYFVGSRKFRKSFQNIEFTLSQPLVANQSIKISYRKNLNDPFTEIGTWTYSELGGVISHYDKALIADAEMVQLRVELIQSSVIFGNNINLVRILLN